MRTFILNFTVKALLVERYEKLKVFIKNSDWKIFEREKFKIKNGILLFPKGWSARFSPFCCDYQIFISSNHIKKLIIIEDIKKTKTWGVVDCCKK